MPAHIELFIDGKPVGDGDLPVTIPLSLGLGAGVCIGSDSGSPVMTDDDYKAPVRLHRHGEEGDGRRLGRIRSRTSRRKCACTSRGNDATLHGDSTDGRTERKPITVTPDNFCRAETDLYFAGFVKDRRRSEGSFTIANRRPSTTRP